MGIYERFACWLFLPSASTAIVSSRWDSFGVLLSRSGILDRHSTFLANSGKNKKSRHNNGLKKGVFAAILKLSKFENSPANFEIHGDGVGYCGGCFGTENDEQKIENTAPFPAGIDSRPVLTYRSFTNLL